MNSNLKLDTIFEEFKKIFLEEDLCSNDLIYNFYIQNFHYFSSSEFITNKTDLENYLDITLSYFRVLYERGRLTKFQLQAENILIIIDEALEKLKISKKPKEYYELKIILADSYHLMRNYIKSKKIFKELAEVKFNFSKSHKKYNDANYRYKKNLNIILIYISLLLMFFNILVNTFYHSFVTRRIIPIALMICLLIFIGDYLLAKREYKKNKVISGTV
jgi:hypothetical protein